MALAPDQPSSSTTQQQVGPIAQQLAAFQANTPQSAAVPKEQAFLNSSQKHPWSWTGFGGYDPPNDKYQRGKTLWDWLQLLIVPVILASGGLWFSTQQNAASLQLSQQQYTQNVRIADDQQKETTLKTTMDDLSSLLLDRQLRNAPENAEVRIIARAKILSALRLLDPLRKSTLLQFLIEAQLVTTGSQNQSLIISLAGANLSGTDLSGAYLYGADLSNADLNHANLSYANLGSASLSQANLNQANLSHADLSGAYLGSANLSQANLSHADLLHATMNGADLRHANLAGATMPDGSTHQ